MPRLGLSLSLPPASALSAGSQGKQMEISESFTKAKCFRSQGAAIWKAAGLFWF